MSAEARAGPGWVLLPPEAVPERWRDRCVPMMLVPLLPSEAEGVLAGEPAEPAIAREDQELLKLAAEGVSAREIARRLHLGSRTVQRRLARFRSELGATSHAELRALLAKRGWFTTSATSPADSERPDLPGGDLRHAGTVREEASD